ncbi:MAG: A/G-specific adenine glycosylase [Planctomycetota bacterium]
METSKARRAARAAATKNQDSATRGMPDARERRRIARALLTWYDGAKRDLPWRRTRDPYLIWLAEVMLQQTRVDTGIGYFERFRVAFPTVEALAAAPLDAVLKQWEGLGYYSRARNLHRAAQTVAAELAGALPRSAAELQRLPGIGRYTAAAVASIAFEEPTAVLDGNVKRVLARLFAIDDAVESGPAQEKLWGLAQSLMPARRCGDFNQAMMELGATVCLPGEPLCLTCPVRSHCRAAAEGRQAELPRRKKAKPLPHLEVVAGAIGDRQGRWLIGRRPEGKMLGGLWEFPGGKVQPGETRAQALARELQEEMGIEVEVGAELGYIDHAYTHFTMRLHLLEARIVKGRAKALQHTAIAWVTQAQLDDYALPTSDKRLVGFLPGGSAAPHRHRGTEKRLGK